jgi:hypothetical protein
LKVNEEIRLYLCGRYEKDKPWQEELIGSPSLGVGTGEAIIGTFLPMLLD